MFPIEYAEALTATQNIIDKTPRDGAWHEIDGYSICIADDCAAIYYPGSATHGECDVYVHL